MGRLAAGCRLDNKQLDAARVTRTPLHTKLIAISSPSRFPFPFPPPSLLSTHYLGIPVRHAPNLAPTAANANADHPTAAAIYMTHSAGHGGPFDLPPSTSAPSGSQTSGSSSAAYERLLPCVSTADDHPASQCPLLMPLMRAMPIGCELPIPAPLLELRPRAASLSSTGQGALGARAVFIQGILSTSQAPDIRASYASPPSPSPLLHQIPVSAECAGSGTTTHVIPAQTVAPYRPLRARATSECSTQDLQICDPNATRPLQADTRAQAVASDGRRTGFAREGALVESSGDDGAQGLGRLRMYNEEPRVCNVPRPVSFQHSRCTNPRLRPRMPKFLFPPATSQLDLISPPSRSFSFTPHSTSFLIFLNTHMHP